MKGAEMGEGASGEGGHGSQASGGAPGGEDDH